MFEVFNYLILTLIGLITFFPFYQVVITSFVTFKEYLSKSVILFPSEWTLESYQFVFSTSKFFTALRNTVVITIVGTVISMAITSIGIPVIETQPEGTTFLLAVYHIPNAFQRRIGSLLSIGEKPTSHQFDLGAYSAGMPGHFLYHTDEEFLYLAARFIGRIGQTGWGQ
jgi:hypothetical protein